MAYFPNRPMTAIAMGLMPFYIGYYALYQEKVDADAIDERILTYSVNFTVTVVLCDLVPRKWSCVMAVDDMLSHTHYITCWSNFLCT